MHKSTKVRLYSGLRTICFCNWICILFSENANNIFNVLCFQSKLKSCYKENKNLNYSIKVRPITNVSVTWLWYLLIRFYCTCIPVWPISWSCFPKYQFRCKGFMIKIREEIEKSWHWFPFFSNCLLLYIDLVTVVVLSMY